MPDIKPLGTSGVNDRQIFLSNGSTTLVVPYGRKKLKKMYFCEPTSSPSKKYGTQVYDAAYLLECDLNTPFTFNTTTGNLTLDVLSTASKIVSETENSFTLQGVYNYFSVMVEY